MLFSWTLCVGMAILLQHCPNTHTIPMCMPFKCDAMILGWSALLMFIYILVSVVMCAWCLRIITKANKQITMSGQLSKIYTQRYQCFLQRTIKFGAIHGGSFISYTSIIISLILYPDDPNNDVFAMLIFASLLICSLGDPFIFTYQSIRHVKEAWIHHTRFIVVVRGWFSKKK